MESNSKRLTVVPGPIIIGSGPSGLAVAATLQKFSIPTLLIERSSTIANLWHNSTSDRLTLHLPKHLCQLPHLPLPRDFPTYPSRSQFISYLHSYAAKFNIHPILNTNVVSARFDTVNSLWNVMAVKSDESNVVLEYVGRWLVVATGENSIPVVPETKKTKAKKTAKKKKKIAMKNKKKVFEGNVVHSSQYRNGEKYRGKRVLVVGCGNSGMEVCLDLWENGALPFMSVRNGVHVLPRNIFGISTFELAMKLLKWLPLKLADKLLLLMTKFMVGDTEKYGLRRPKVGPLELKMTKGKTPVLDVGALSLIKQGKIKIVPEVEIYRSNVAKFADGTEMEFNSVILATGYRSNVPTWLKEPDFFSQERKTKDSLSDNDWKGKNGIYFVGFGGKGLHGISSDAQNIGRDIAEEFKKLPIDS